jgi:hypothetical protein
LSIRTPVIIIAGGQVGKKEILVTSRAMPTFDRRQFLTHTAAGTAAALARPAQAADTARDQSSAIDFRYAPLSGQTAFCFPDDHAKSLIGERGELRYASLTVEFSLLGMEPDVVAEQRLEAPEIPVVHTRIERPEAWLELTTFATNRAGEGRVDNVIIEVRPRTATRVYAIPVIAVKAKREVNVKAEGAGSAVSLEGSATPLLISDAPLGGRNAFTFPEGAAEASRPLRRFVRLPQEGQRAERLREGLAAPESLLDEVRGYWRSWRAFGGAVAWQLPGRYGEFLRACARNILQAREMKDGRLTFQVGPTVYRGLWVVDGHFILEAARYLGYDAEAQQGLETTWARQRADGGIFAGGGAEHWKDTGIAMFTLVRQCELAQDFSYFLKMRSEILRAAGFLRDMRDKGRNEDSANGRYGLLPRGFGDGGLGGLRSEFTNTLWAMAGLKAVAETAARLKAPGFEPVSQLYADLGSALRAAMPREMRRHRAGFDYLPMLMKEDKAWEAPNERDRPQPQIAQWALSHAIYPGLLFEPADPVVRGHVALMQASTKEDIPAETGWLPHEGVWNYNAAFVAHVYLWAGLPDWARLTFHGFLNHATPLYCWREEQPLRGSLSAGYVGDMPHNWASAECVLFLRHMLALEDGGALRLIPGIGDFELATGDPYRVDQTPTRFGRLSVSLQPSGARRWRVTVERGGGQEPDSVVLPAVLGSGLRLTDVKGAATKPDGARVLVDPTARSWTAVYGA